MNTDRAEQALELRRRAALCREAAGYPTHGGRLQDRILEELAREFERRAEEIEASG